jgi:uncharacterized protein (TIGR00297 family)
VALAAWRAKSLTLGGALTATLVGTLVLVGTGWPGGLVLGVFFVGSSVVGRLTDGKDSKDGEDEAVLTLPSLPPLPAPDPKSNQRDPWQVLANGGPAAIAALIGNDNPSLALWIVTASLAAAAADTWATSIGGLSRTPPRLLVSGRVVAPGTSGGVTPIGSIGGLVGAAIVAATGALAGGEWRLFVFGTLIGFAGMLVDSVLGGTLQGRFYCTRCDAPSEWRRHRCGAATVHREGIAWLNNDAVNLAATSLAALAGAAVWSSWPP